ncbi:MAG: hypothetical protein ACK56I_03450 [bacterium]
MAARVRGSQADFSSAAATSGRSACEASSRTSSSPSGRSHSRAVAGSATSAIRVATLRLDARRSSWRV